MYRKLIRTLLILLAVVLTAMPLPAAFADTVGSMDVVSDAAESVDVVTDPVDPDAVPESAEVLDATEDPVEMDEETEPVESTDEDETPLDSAAISDSVDPAAVDEAAEASDETADTADTAEVTEPEVSLDEAEPPVDSAAVSDSVEPVTVDETDEVPDDAEKPVGKAAAEEPAAPESVNSDAVDTAFYSTRDMLSALAEKAGWSEECNWIVMGLARAGELTEDMGKAYSSNVCKVLTENQSATMNSKQSSNNSRAVLALTAAGYDVTDVGGYNLLEPLANIGYVRSQGMNGPIWALIAFDCGAYDIPEYSKPLLQTTRQKLVDSILSSQRDDHGWAFSGSSSDVDMTCMAIQALAPYYSGEGAGVDEVSEETLQKVRTAVEEAIVWLSSAQNDDGSFSSGGYINSESSSQAIVMLTGMGIDPTDNDILLKAGKGPVDSLLSFYVKGGGFKHISSNSWLICHSNSYY